MKKLLLTFLIVTTFTTTVFSRSMANALPSSFAIMNAPVILLTGGVTLLAQQTAVGFAVATVSTYASGEDLGVKSIGRNFLAGSFIPFPTSGAGQFSRFASALNVTAKARSVATSISRNSLTKLSNVMKSSKAVTERGIGKFVPKDFITKTRLEVNTLRQQGLNISEAFQQIRRFNSGNADGYLFHFTDFKGGKGILDKGEFFASPNGLGGPGVYFGTVPKPNIFQKYFSPIGWGVNPGSIVRIPFKPTMDMGVRTPLLPRWTRIIGEGSNVPLK